MREESNTSLSEQVLQQGRELHLAMIDGDQPYVVPLNYGYAAGCIYIHSGRAGKKLECLRRNPRVCFSVHQMLERVGGERACQWTTKFRSIVGYGTARILDDREEKIRGYDVLMTHFGGPVGNYAENYLQGSLIIRIEIEKLTEKQSKED